ncbi:MAG: site-2 protease family protein, partial [Polyangiaceae bacterium]
MIGSRGLRLGRVFGIQIAIDLSWIFIVVLMTWSLSAAFTRWHPDWGVATVLGTSLLASLLFFVSVILHELAHSLVARRFGIPVTSIVLFLFGGVSNIEREPSSPGSEFLTAVVGPLTSIVLGVILLALGTIVTRSTSDELLEPAEVLARLTPGQSLLLWLGPINILVGVFNLIPGFPLDGGRILRSAIWGITRDVRVATRWASAIGQAIGWGLVFLGVAIVFGARIPFFGQGLIAGLWLAFIGWFLSSAAAQTWRRELTREVLEGLTVARLMVAPGPAVPAKINVAALLEDWMMRGDSRAFPVEGDAGRFVGLVTLEDVRRTPREAWDSTEVCAAMTPLAKLVAAAPSDDLSQAADKMARADVAQLPVLDADSRLVGL